MKINIYLLIFSLSSCLPILSLGQGFTNVTRSINAGNYINVGSASFVNTSYSDSISEEGLNNYIAYTVNSNQKSSYSHDVGLMMEYDKMPPEAKAITNLVIELGTDGTATVTPQQVNDGSTDNQTDQANLQFSLSKTSFSCSDIEVHEEWQLVNETPISASSSRYQSLAIAPDGTPYVAYSDAASSSKTTVQKWNGSSWEALGGTGISGGDANDQSLAIAPDGTPYVAYRDVGKTTVVKWNGSSWEAVGGTGISAGDAYYQSLAIAPDGTPYVAYRDNEYGGRTIVLTWNGSSWEAVGERRGISAGEAHYQSLAIAPDGSPYVAYKDIPFGYKTTVKKWNGSSWEALGGSGISARQAYDQSLAIAPDGTPYVAYSDDSEDRKTTVLKWNGSSWEALGGAGFSASSAFEQSLAIAPDGTPYVAYADNGYRTIVQTYFQSNRITLSVEDEAGNKATSGTLVTVADRKAPVIEEEQVFSVEENSMESTVIGNISATDNCSLLNWTIISGNTDDAFTVNESGAIVVNNSAALDYGTTPEFVLTISVADQGNNVSSTTVTIQLLRDPTGLFDSERQTKLEAFVYPNPTSGSIVIGLEEALKGENVNISLYDLEGRLLIQGKGNLGQETAKLSAYLEAARKGVYLLKLEVREQLKTVRLMKK